MPACSSSTGPPSILVSSGGTVGESRAVGPGSSPALMAEPLPWRHPSPGLAALREAVPPAPPKRKSLHLCFRVASPKALCSQLPALLQLFLYSLDRLLILYPASLQATHR